MAKKFYCGPGPEGSGILEQAVYQGRIDTLIVDAGVSCPVNIHVTSEGTPVTKAELRIVGGSSDSTEQSPYIDAIVESIAEDNLGICIRVCNAAENSNVALELTLPAHMMDYCQLTCGAVHIDDVLVTHRMSVSAYGPVRAGIACSMIDLKSAGDIAVSFHSVDNRKNLNRQFNGNSFITVFSGEGNITITPVGFTNTMLTTYSNGQEETRRTGITDFSRILSGKLTANRGSITIQQT